MTHPVLRTPASLSAWGPFAVAVLAALSAAGHLLVAWPLMGFGLVSVVWAWPRRVDVGAEGIRVRSRFGLGGKTIPYTTIRLAAPDGPRRVVLRTMKDESLTLHSGLFTTVPGEVLDRLWKAIAAGAEDGVRGVERQALARSGRSTPGWRAALRELAKPATYRTASVSRDRLWTIAENPGLDLEVRGGAIVALSASSLDDAGRQRLRRIDSATLHPALHALLLHAVSDRGEPDDRVVDAALDGLAR